MIITREQLADIESIVGHSCEVGVLADPDRGDLIVHIQAEQPDGQFFNYEYTLKIRHIVDASALVPTQFCSRDGWQERIVNCIYFGPGAACSNGGPCDDQIPF